MLIGITKLSGMVSVRVLLADIIPEKGKMKSDPLENAIAERINGIL